MWRASGNTSTGSGSCPRSSSTLGDAVVVALRIEGRGRGSGAPFEQRLANRITLRDGLIASITAFPTVDEALAP